jgi:hypothetical protein
MELHGTERARYFAPTAICGYLALLCVALMITSGFLAGMHDAIALTAAGAFGLFLSGGLGLVFWRAQRHDLEFLRIPTRADAAANFRAVRAAAVEAGWRVTGEESERWLAAQTADTTFSVGERVRIEFRGRDVLVASICDPGVGFSLVGRRRCAQHRDAVRRALLTRPASTPRTT